MKHGTREAEVKAGVDTGGTFTDLVSVVGDRVEVEKVPSTPSDPSRAILEAVQARGLDVRANLLLIHGSTVATNALLERKGARVALVTNAGFEDVIAIGRQARPELYALAPRPEDPLVPPERRLGVRERTTWEGEIILPLTSAELAAIRRRVARAEPESIAVCLLHAYCNPRSERRLRAALAPLALDVSLSSEVAPEFREFERCSTTVVNAYLQPVMVAYLARLASRLRGARVLMMQSSGGLCSLASARRLAVRTVLSGPAGGVAGAHLVARRSGLDRVITFDMGGTSTDVSLIDGEPALTHVLRVGQRPLLLPSVDVHTVGAGGGSIAWRDLGGALRVGPQSAGADPGPACYGRGREPTVTDAHLALGRLPAEGLLGGRMRLDGERAMAAIARLARTIGATPIATARAILDVADAVMARAIKAITLRRGHDPGRFRLLAFGGAGGLHSVRLARLLDIPEVIVPPLPGALSALGMVGADLVHDVSRTILWPVADGLGRDLESLLSALESGARRALARDLPGARPRATWSLDCRYRGQSFEINVPFGRDFGARFERAHEERYGHRLRGRAIEVVNARVRLSEQRAPLPLARYARTTNGAEASFARPLFPGLPRLRVVARDRLKPGDRLRGPALVRELSGTTIVEERCELTVDEQLNLRIHVR
jgi:N-methylhydantoinase A